MTSAYKQNGKLSSIDTRWKGAPLDLSGIPYTLFNALRQIRRMRGGSTKILQDEASAPLSYDDIVTAACALSAKIAKITSSRETVGMLLPTCAPAVITFFAMQAAARVPAILNFHAGASSLQETCALAGVKCIITSRRFIKAAKLYRTISKLQSSVSIIYLEDMRQTITPVDGLVALLRSFFPALLPERSKPHDPAVILFTSGTTGAPKGVALSHANLLANITQCRVHIPFDPDWIFFNALPMFHAFGLTGGTLLPLLGGMKTVLYPSPLDHERIPKIIQASGANVLVSTDTFARMYARAAGAKTFAGLRYIVLGGESVSDATVRLFSEKSPAIVLQGYGATECSPVIAVNKPGADRPNTVGKLLPGMEGRLEVVSGVSVGARLFVRGPNVMLGYLDPYKRGEAAPQSDEWFDTGDLVRVDEDGFITVTGRTKRFARIGAEMVSLAAVEDYAQSIWPAGRHAAIAVARAKGGEAIVLVTDQKRAERTDFAAWARAHDLPHFAVPHRILVVRKTPRLATGKPDYLAIRRIVRKKLGETNFFNHQAIGASGDNGKVRST